MVRQTMSSYSYLTVKIRRAMEDAEVQDFSYHNYTAASIFKTLPEK